MRRGNGPARGLGTSLTKPDEALGARLQVGSRTNQGGLHGLDGIAAGHRTVMAAPTGSGKTLAANDLGPPPCLRSRRAAFWAPETKDRRLVR